MAAQINNTLVKPRTQGFVNPMPQPMMGGGAPTIPSVSNAPLGSLGGAVKSHTITISPDGTQKHTVAHDTGEKQTTSGLVSPTKTPAPKPPQHQIHVINGMHHVPFRASDGSIKHINAKGEII